MVIMPLVSDWVKTVSSNLAKAAVVVAEGVVE
ncbi:MAG: hypothetical protein ACI9VN_001909 [Patescibacteria group bacterium]